MPRLLLLLLDNLDLILTVLGALSAYLWNGKEFLQRIDVLKGTIQRWRDFRDRHTNFELYFTLIFTLISAAACAPLIVERWPRIAGWWQGLHDRFPQALPWVVFVVALCLAFGLFELRKQALKGYAFLEILVGVCVVAINSWDGTQPMMAGNAKMAAAVYAIIRGLVNLADAVKREQLKRKDKPEDKKTL